MTDTQANRLAVIGAGSMGTGIAALATAYGVPVMLIDSDATARQRAAAVVRQGRRLGVMLGRLSAETEPGELRVEAELIAVAGATVVIEAVVEVPAVKYEVISAAAAAVAPGTPIVSNTSAIPIDELAGHASRPGEVVGVHFMNPAQLIRMVEVIRGPRSSAAVLERVVGLLGRWELEAVVVGDGPGFVINRILQRMINEAARVVQDGIATATEVDALFCGCLGHRSGPLSTADLIGIDNVVDSLRVLQERTGDAGYQPCELLLAKTSAGELGRKTNKGFYDY